MVSPEASMHVTHLITFHAGHIVTNFHVIKGAANIKVALIDQSVYPATVSIQKRQILCPTYLFLHTYPHPHHMVQIT